VSPLVKDDEFLDASALPGNTYFYRVQAMDPDTLTSVCCPAFDFDVILWGWGSDPDPNLLLSVMTTEEIPTGSSETGYSNPTYDVRATAAATGVSGEAKILVINGVTGTEAESAANVTITTSETTLATNRYLLEKSGELGGNMRRVRYLMDGSTRRKSSMN
jgi:hypothetical protein